MPATADDSGIDIDVEISERPSLDVDLSTVRLEPGDKVTIKGRGFARTTPYDLDLHSTPTALGQVTSDAEGAFELATTIPMSTVPGEHHLTATDAAGTVVESEPFTVYAASPGGDENGTGDDGTGDNGSGDNGSGDNGSGADGAAGGGGGGGGSLPMTGASIAGIVGGAAVLVAAGTVLVRRRARTVREA